MSVVEYRCPPQLIAGAWRPGTGRRLLQVVNPANAQVIGEMPAAGDADIDTALAATALAFEAWRDGA